MKIEAPNFLAEYLKKPITKWAILLLVFFAFVYLVLFQVSPMLAILIFCALVLLLFSMHLNWGIYILAAVGFFHGWVINFSNYSWARNIPYLSGIDAPMVDFVALILLLGVLGAWWFRFYKFDFKKIGRLFPGFLFYGLFLLAAVISLAGIYEHMTAEGIKYLLRPLIFIYIFFVSLPLLVIQKKKYLMQVLKIFYWVGIIIAIFGLLSLLKQIGAGGWLRVTPFAIFGFAPLGYNHNLLAEVLVAIIPVAAFVSFKKEKASQKWHLFGVFLMIAAALLTLSRAAWVALGVEALIAFLFFYRHQVISWLKSSATAMFLLIIFALLFLGYMASFLGSSVVDSSNSARVMTTEIALYYSVRDPVFGYGPGMFIPILNSVFAFTLEFGEALDSHGLVQKVLLEEGIVGLLFFVSFLIYVLRTLWLFTKEGKDKDLFQALLLMVLGAIVFQLFNTSYFNANMWLPIGIALSAAQLARYGKEYFYEE